MSENRSIQEIHTCVGQIGALFPLLECVPCAVAIMQWLDRSNIPYQLLRLKTKRRSDLYIVSNRIISGESITENGSHYGVEVFGLVFDNLFRTGLSRDAWLRDFSCRSGAFTIEEIDCF